MELCSNSISNTSSNCDIELFQPNNKETIDDKNFGSKVVINKKEDILIIAGYLEASAGIDAGAVYVFGLTASNFFNQTQRIVPNGLRQFAHFGEDMLIIDDVLLIGGHRQDADIVEGGISIAECYK